MICIAGKNNIATNVLEFVAKRYGTDQLVAVANRDDTGKPTWQHSLTATAARLGVRLVTLEEAYTLPNLHFFSVEFDRIVVPSRFQDAELYNIHFSLLPYYKGVYTSVWPLLNGEKQTGVTLHRMEAGIDTGPIIHQAVLPISLDDTARDVYYGCLALGTEVLCEFIPQLVEQPQAGIPQSVTDSTYYGPKSIDYANLQIDLRRTAFQIHNTVRAFSFQEYQLPTVLGRRVRASRLTERVSTAKPGTILEEDDQGFFISTIDFDLYLIKDYSKQLLEAISAADAAAVRTLASHVPSLEFQTRQGWTPLMMAAYNGHLPVVQALVENGADVNARNLNGTSVLMYAKSGLAVNGSQDVSLLDYLIGHGADAHAVDRAGLSVLAYAEREGNAVIIEYFRNLL